MRYVDGSDIQNGARVRLTHPDPGYELGRANPAIGTEWFCDGVYQGEGHVQWDNGYTNSYKSG